MPSHASACACACVCVSVSHFERVTLCIGLKAYISEPFVAQLSVLARFKIEQHQ